METIRSANPLWAAPTSPARFPRRSVCLSWAGSTTRSLAAWNKFARGFRSLSRNPSVWDHLEINLSNVNPVHFEAIIERCTKLRTLRIVLDVRFDDEFVQAYFQSR
jgi:hypothetical protein